MKAMIFRYICLRLRKYEDILNMFMNMKGNNTSLHNHYLEERHCSHLRFRVCFVLWKKEILIIWVRSVFKILFIGGRKNNTISSPEPDLKGQWTIVITWRMSSFYIFNGVIVFSCIIKFIFLHDDAFNYYLLSFSL